MRRRNRPEHFDLLTEGDKNLIFRTLHASPLIKEVHIFMSNRSKDVRITIDLPWVIKIVHGKRYVENQREILRKMIHKDLGVKVKVATYEPFFLWRIKMKIRKIFKKKS